MSEDERKQLAYVAMMLYRIADSGGLTESERQSLHNIASELGFSDLDEKHFRY